MPRLANVLCSRFEAAPFEALSLCEHEPDAAGTAGPGGWSLLGFVGFDDLALDIALHALGVDAIIGAHVDLDRVALA